MVRRVAVRWTAGMEFVAENEDGATIDLSNSTSEFRPTGLLLAGLAGCTGMDAISIMTKKRVQVSSYRVEAVGEQRDEHPRVFTHIVVTHIVEGGAALDDVAIRRAIELSARKYCTVGAMLAAGDTAIDHVLRTIDELGERTCDCLTIGPRGAGLVHVDGGVAETSTA